MITNADLTIYHKEFDQATRKSLFLRQVIRNISWYAKLQVTADSGGISGGNLFRIRIPREAEADGLPALPGYLPYGEYRLLSETEREGMWTVNTGDYFCKGVGPELEKPSDLKDYSLPYGQIKSVGDNRRGGQPHIRLEGW